MAKVEKLTKEQQEIIDNAENFHKKECENHGKKHPLALDAALYVKQLRQHFAGEKVDEVPETYANFEEEKND